MLDTTPERELPREAWRPIFHAMDAEIDRLVARGVDREQACAKLAGYALAKQADAAQQESRKKKRTTRIV